MANERSRDVLTNANGGVTTGRSEHGLALFLALKGHYLLGFGGRTGRRRWCLCSDIVLPRVCVDHLVALRMVSRSPSVIL